MFMLIEHIQVTASDNKRSKVKSAKDFFNKYGSLQIY